MKCSVVGCVLDMAVLCGMTRVEWFVVLLCLVVVICECLLCSLCADDSCFDVPLIVDCLCLSLVGEILAAGLCVDDP